MSTSTELTSFFRYKKPYLEKGLCPDCPEHKPLINKNKCLKCRERYNLLKRERFARERDRIIQGYGSKCVCCGETEPLFLSIDHVVPCGKNRKQTYQLFKQILDENFPEDYQLLCFNCNCGRDINGGICPHSDPSHTTI